MSVSKDGKRGTWYVQCWYRDWQNERHKKTKRGFKSKKDAEAWERDFVARCNGAPTMTFGEFCSLYAEDMKPRLKRNTWLTKEHMIRTKILPYFKDKAVNEIKPTDIIKWENAMLESRTSTGREYAPTYLRAVSNQLSAILNHAVKFYGLDYNPMTKVECIGAKSAGEMQYWTKDEYLAFSKTVMDKPDSFLAFELLYWTGMRVGELLALTPADFDFRKQTVEITKSYQRLRGEDVVTSPKTPKSVRTIVMPEFLTDEVKDHLRLFPHGDAERIFAFTKSFLHHEMDRGCKQSGVKRIRVHDLRHSHVSLLIEMGYSALAIAERMGHESTDITMNYAHLFPNKQNDMARALNRERKETT